MVNYEDLFSVPYLEHGRDLKNGLDCYGLVLELCRRDGHPIPDIYTDPEAKANLIQILKPAYGDIMECYEKGRLHCGFMLNTRMVIHMTKKGLQVLPVSFFTNPQFYRSI